MAPSLLFRLHFLGFRALWDFLPLPDPDHPSFLAPFCFGGGGGIPPDYASRWCPASFVRAACLQNEIAPKSFNFKTKNGPKNDPKLPRKILSLVLLCRISHRHYSKIFHREFPHKIKYFFHDENLQPRGAPRSPSPPPSRGAAERAERGLVAA